MPTVKISLPLGNSIELVGILVAVWLLFVAPGVNEVLLRFLTYLLAWGCLEFFPHCLAHFVTGRLVGVRFNHYVINRSPIVKLKLPIISQAMSNVPVLGLKIDRGSLTSVSQGRRRVMFASGIAASVILPFFAAVASYGRLPLLLSGGLFVLSVGNLASDLYYSPKAGDISRLSPDLQLLPAPL